MSEQGPEKSSLEGIAIVGMSGRFPGADDLAELWRNLCGGVESITFYSREELEAAGVDPALLDDPRYVRAGAALRDVQSFDAAFFGFSPREAELLDPQQRVFLECSWEALENAGYDTETYAGSIGLFAGMGMSSYLIHNLLSHRDLIQSAGALQVRILNDNNYLTAMAAFKLDLRGPSVTVQSACSTSLVATCMACQSLLLFQCDMALAGGVTVVVPHARGYLAQESVMSPDGRCRAFDAEAGGTVEGSGAGVVLLKRLADAVADGDTVHAVIRGFATNNDGGFKMSFTAPSLDGQLEVIAMAQAMAGVPAESITYIEAHGTGTPLGDPVEVAALSEVFAAAAGRRGFCALGSIKTNIGHLDAAAGVAGLIKTVLAVEHGVLPPSLNFEKPNPRIDFSRSPFYVNTECRPWRPEGWPRRAGVSAFAIGGVNAHVILEEPPAREPSAPAMPWHLLVLSARTETALETASDRLLRHLQEPSQADANLADIADIAYTLQVGRRAFRHRRLLVCRDAADAAGVLERRDPRRLLTGIAAAGEPQVAFLFPGLGNEYAGMARGLYRDDPGFRARIDDCAARLEPLLGLDLRELLFPEVADEGAAEPGIDLRALLGRASRPGDGETDRRLRRTALSQPAVFAVEYALAGRLLDWGIRPQAMVGFSIGEYVAACLSGVLSLDDALRLVAGRARLIDELPPGAMVAVPLSEEAVAPWLATGLSLAAVAGPDLTVLAGTEEAVARAEEELTAAGHVCRRLQTTHAFHSTLMEPAVERFLALFDGIDLRPPEIPYLSNVTGDWITEEQATDPAYWVEHLLRTVRFADAVSELWREPGRVLVEVGPGQTLSSWALQHPAMAAMGATAHPVALPTLRHAFDRTDDLAFLLQTVGRLWLTGLRPDWPALWADQPRRRVPLPTYPFERRRYWIEPYTETAVRALPAPATPLARPEAGAPSAATPARQHPRPNLHVPYAPPRDATERRLVEILGELLHVETVGIHDGFFDLGGDSLLATHLVARLNRELGAELTLRSVFEAPTAAELAAAVAARRGSGAAAWGPVVRRAGAAPPPLSFAQRRLWFLDQLEPGDPAYNVPAAVLLTGPLDRSVLAASLDEVMARHEALRTTFGPADGRGEGGDGEPVQRIAPPSALPLPRIDLDGLPEGARETEALRLAAEEALRPFDLARGPLLRAALLRLGAERHAFLFTLHHMVGDGWSSDLLVRELVTLYPAFAAGRPSPLAPLPVQYADFVLWQRENLAGEELERQLAFWRGDLADAPAALELPADRPRPARMSTRGGLAAATVGAEGIESLKALGRRTGATPFMTLLAAFYALLYRYTGETDLVAGTPIANRRRPELEELIGFFANTLVLRAGLHQNEPTFAGLLAQVREAALSAYAHQDLPFERLVEELAPERSLARTPLFQVMFLLHGTPFEGLEQPGFTIEPFGGLDALRRTAKFDLTLELVESGAGMTALLEFRRDLFDDATAVRLLGHFAALAAGLAAAPGERIAELPLLTAGERQQLMEWSAGGESFPPSAQCLHDAFEARAAEWPEAPALVCGGETLTYGALDARAGRLARHLRALGVGPEVPVAVCAGRSADLVVALLAVLKAGGAYLPLDPGYPRERLSFLMEDTAAPVLVAPSRLAELPPAGAVRVALDAPETWTAGEGGLPPLALPANLAYLIYTSGSTGRPKGVAIPHGAAAALVRWAAEVFSAGELDGVLASTSVSFDLSVFELFVPLSLGGRVILAENALELPRLAAASQVRLINTVPSAMGELVELGAIPPSVRTVGLAGEPLRRDLVERIYAAAPHVERVLNLYGPSETTTYSTWETVERGEAGQPAIGQPIAGTQAYVLDGALAPVPIGVPGELFLGGAGLARGYLGRPALTAEKWLPDPFAAAAGERLYRTGDRVRRRPDGRLELLGRADAQVKIRGFRIEPGEIEAALTAHPAVAEAAVVVRDEGGDRRLVAWVVARPGADLTAASLRTALGERLPAFMVPAVFALVEDLPRNANGKLDRAALARRPVEAPAAVEAVGPSSPLEEGIAAILAEVLGRERVGRGESFFDLGGHSLLATRVISRLRAAFGVELSVRRLFEAPTAAGLAAEVAAASHSGAPEATPLVPLAAAAREGGSPLSFAQQRLWFLDQLEPGSPLYNIPLKVELGGRVDPGTLAAALGEVVRRHEVLRTRFSATLEGPVQMVGASAPVTLAQVDLGALPPAESRREEARLTSEEARRPFDLAHGPLLRMLLLRRREEDQVLVLSMHHIVSDGWSLGVLVQELAALYPAFLAGRPSPLPELAIQYADFAVWQRQFLSGGRLEPELAWWRERLAGMPLVLDLPADRPRPAVASGRGAVHGFAVGREVLAGLKLLSRQSGATLFMALLAGFAALLQRISGDGSQEDLGVGTPIAGRTRVELEPLIGFFVNTLVLRVDLSGDLDFATLLGRVRETTLAAYVHQELPFERLVEELAPERDRGVPPVVQVMLALQNAAAGPLDLPGLELEAAALPTGTAKLDLTVMLLETAQGLSAEMEYNRDLFDGAAIERLADRFVRLLAGIAADPLGRLSELPLLSEAEEQETFIEWNDTATAYPREACLHELFSAVARTMPEAPAIVVPAAGGQSAEVWAYGRLDAVSDRLARRLLSLGVGLQTPVCLSMERSPELIAGILAILKAGGLYVPLDASYPDERLAFMLADLGAGIVLVHGRTRERLSGLARQAGLVDLTALDIGDQGDQGDQETGEATPLGVRVPAESAACVIYTSGSTGRSKGVVLPHRAVVRLARETDYVRLGPGDRVGQVANISFDAATWEIWGALLNGAALVVIPRDVALSAADLAAVLRQQEVDALLLTTALFNRTAHEAPDAFAGVRDLLFGGEAADPAAARAVLASRPPRRLVHAYGPTESATYASWHLLREVPPEAASLPIGSPVSNTTLYVLDRRLVPVPPGTAGELCVGGDGLAWGYWNRPELTAERFVPDPWQAGGRLYRTGDLVRRPAGGALDFLGRIDQQVKIRGFRIEPGEIEAALLSHAQVLSAVVLPRRDATGSVDLVAYVVAAEEGASGAAELREMLRRRLPAFMLPTGWVFLPSLPLTANGKVDRKALAKLRPERTAPEPGSTRAAGAAPRTPAEELVARIFAEVLGLEQVGVTDDFFALGGHSLLATQVASRLRSVLGAEVPLRAVFERPTVAGLVAEITRMRAEGSPAEAPPLSRVSREEPLALSFAQQRLWFLDRLAPGSPLYNIPLQVELRGRLDPATLAAVLGEVVRRHEVLRTRFGVGARGPVQVIEAAAPFPLALADLSGLPRPQRLREEARLTGEEALRPFDLARGPLLRALLLCRGEDDWALVLSMHHIVSDGWSMGVLVQEVGALYPALLDGRPSPLPELAVQYADFAAWQRRSLSGARLASEVAWWREQLAGMPSALDLPADRPRPAALSARGGAHRFAVDEETAAGLVRLSRRSGATLFMALLAGFAALLQRASDDPSRDELAVGTPVAGRTRVELEPLIGFFVNTLVLRVDLSGDPDFAALLDRVRETTLAAYAHQELPFERLVEELAPERDRSRAPLVQVMFALQNAAAGPLDLPGLELQAVALPSGTAKLDLTVSLAETEQGLRGDIEYSRDLFDAATIERLADRFARLLAGIVADPLGRVSELPLLSAAEQQHLIEWNGTATAYPREACLQELFAAVARAMPDAPAIVAPAASGQAAEVWTYGRLDAASDRLAGRLRSLGVGLQTPVCLSMERSPELIAGILAILKAGGLYVPLDASYPDERLAFMLADVGAGIVLVHGPTRERLSGLAHQAELVDMTALDGGASEDEEAIPLSVRVPAESAAYVIYTSGSTGQPKGVAVPHRAIVRLVRETDFARLGPGDRMGQVANISFDAATWEIWGALLNGAAVVVIPRDAVLSAADLAAALRQQEITSLFLTTALFNRMAREVPDAFAGVRDLLFGGEAADPAMARAVLTSRPPRRLLHVYGPTESTTYASWHLLREVPPEAASLPIGSPLANTTLHVLDRRLLPVPPGTAGELCIGGDGLAWGYWNRPELTAERFVPDPWQAGGRLYRTGDLARRPAGGALEFLGRIDQQVKIRGFRIEPGEIEAALLSHAHVRSAVVLPRRDAKGSLDLVAYVVREQEGAPGTPGMTELRQMLAERLPAFMLPAVWVFLPSLPLTANGKVDRKALAKLRPERTAPEAGSTGAAPRTPTEELVAGIFAEVLGLEQVGVTDDFFALGGHSLLATQVTARVRAAFGVELPVRTVFETPTVAGLAGWIEERSSAPATSPLVRVARRESLPLSFAQQRLWFLDQMEPGSPLYNVPAAVTLTGRLDRGALAAALGEVVRRHETLRTTFASVEGAPVQLVAEPAGLALPQIDLQGLPEGARAQEERRLTAADARRPFDLSGPRELLRASLLRLGAERHVLLLTVHHIVSDGWSMGVMVREIGALYAAFAAGRPSPLPELPIQYADFAVWQRRFLSGEALEAELAWWREQLAGMPPALELPTDYPRPAERSTRGAVYNFTIPGQGLTAFSRRQGATLFMLLLAGFAGLLQRFTGEEDLAVGTPIAGRTQVETEPLIGFFINTLVLRLGLSGSPSFLELLARVRETALAAYAHQELPFERLVEELAPERDRSRPPLVQVLFALQNTPAESLALPGLDLTVFSQDTGTAKLELSCVLAATEGGLTGTLEYNRDLFGRTTAIRLAEGLARLLDAAVTAPETRVADLPVLGPAERAALLCEWNDTAPPRPPASRAPLVHELFAAWAQRRPEALAVTAGGKQLSYGELAARAGRLARHLAGLGVGPEVRVALCAGPTVYRTIGSLAVLLAGGAYVPMDPEAPPERLAFVVADSGAAAVLTEQPLTFLFDPWAVPVIELESGDWGEPAGSPPVPAVGPESLAYVVYTSGSTGRPKGVAISHGGLLNLVSWHQAVYGLSPADRGTLIANPAFDASVWELWPCLTAGASLHLPDGEARFSPEALVRFWRSAGITWSFLPTPLAEEVIAQGADSLMGLSLQGLLCGGDRLHRGPEPGVPFALINHYGPSEVSVVSTFAAVPPGSVGAPPIGRPIGGVRAFVADAQGSLVPRGASGELWLGGASLARGYLGRPALTAERFVPDPWSGEAGERLYRTGDLVRYRPDGSLEFLGRIDYQIKLRGFRIEPGEIEAALREHLAVSEAAVAVHAQRLVAYVVGAGEHAPSGGELRDFLRERLPGPLVPASYVVLSALPLTPNGKLDRKALAALGPAAAGGVSMPPRTPAEELVAGIFSEVLEVGPVGVEDDFFTLGGHSLLATQVAARVRSAFGIELPVRSVFERPTVAGLASEISVLSAEGHLAQALPPPARVERVGPLPLSFSQERLWFLQQLEPGSAAYNMPLELELSGVLRIGALAAALSEVLRRHESLRTTFVPVAGELCQRIAPPAPAVSLPLVDLSALPEAVRQPAAESLSQWHAGRGFDLERGPLFVWLLVRLAGERHLLLLNLHHTIADGWSISVLSRELGELYAAFLDGRPSRLPELPIQYADFASWQRRWLAERQEEELAYWESRLGGEIASAELPTDRPRPAIQTFRGGRRQRMLSEDLTARLKRFGRAENLTLFMTLLAATQVLLARHSGEHDVAVGVPVAGRQWAEAEGLIGCFLNTLVLRTDTSGEPSFRELAARVRTVTLEAYSHQSVPFEAVLARLGLRRDLSRTPLFQVLFNLLNLPATELSLPGLELRSLTPAEVPSKLDMTFYISEIDASLAIHLVYNADLFDQARMEDLLAQLEIFLDEALERPEVPVGALPLVTAAMGSVLPDPTLALDRSWIGSVYELFAAAAERAPERTAVAHPAGVQTYAGLLSASRRVAGWLAAQGVRPGDPVAILAVRAAPVIEAVLGTLGAGGAFVMLDSAYPALRQLEMLRLACPRALISFAGPEGTVPAEVRSWLEESGCPRLELPAGGAGAVADLAPFAWEAPQVRVGPEDLACIGFTSGSTGGPKGVWGLHGSLSHFLPTHCRLFDLGPDDRFSLLSGLGHDPLQREIFTPLYLGAAIVVPDPADYGIAGRLAAWLRRERVTVSHLTPTLGQLLTELPPGETREVVPSLRRVLLVGESLTRKDVARLRALAPEVSCINLYGSTETQRAVAFHWVAPEEAEAIPAMAERAQQVLPLGRGVPDVQLLVLNPAGGLAGLGELGEIAVRSPHLARGYRDNAELTAQRFQINPFTGEPADRIYRTGDLGRYRSDGEVVFAGRLDQQIKLRGFRIELGEIEGVLVGLPGVLEAVVLLRTDLPGGAGLVAYVRTEEGRVESLRGELEARLPAYMVPTAFVRLDKLPRNANGKLDRRALLQITPELGGVAARTLPRTPAEELLAGIWSQVLRIEQIGADQSFFELGGHSLLATQMASRVRDVFGVELPLRSLFVTPTLAGLAAEIEHLRSGAPELPTIASFRQDRGAPPPLSFAQERYWAGRHLEARSVASTVPMLMHLAGPLDRDCLRQAIAAVVDRHELLRTSFRDGPEGPVQVVHPAVPMALPEVDLAQLGAAERVAEVRRFSILDGRLHFDYERPPLFRSTLFRCAAEEHLLLFTIHHVATDWWSNAVLLREVSALYLAFRAGQPSPLPPLPAQFQDFARWQRRLSLEEAQASQVTFWREHLRGAVPIDLGAGRPRPRRRTFTAGTEEILVPEELERQLDALSAQQGVTLFMTLLAAFKALLYSETGQDDLVVPCSFANRNQLETESLIGNLATGLPLRTRLSGVLTFRELLQQVRDVTLLAHDHPDIFWEPVVEGMSFLEEGDRGGLTTFRILFQLIKAPPAAPAQNQGLAEAASGLRITQLPVDTGKIRLDLSLFLSQADRLAGRFRYNRDVLDEARVKGLGDRFLRILAAAVADPECPLSELPLAESVPHELGTRDLAILSGSINSSRR